MRIQVVAVGKLKEKYLRDGCAEFIKRLSRFCKLGIIELAEEYIPENFSDKELNAALLREGERILKAVGNNRTCIVLDVGGTQLSSTQLAAHINRYALSGKSDIAIVIGGAFGLADNVRQTADLRLSFSSMTFTHQMVRLLLLEQLYRSFKINNNGKYHW